ncbi:hypothetical protein DO71_5162 [Burkholderia pseudomallei]|nr:hypothetical protein BURPS305_5023 [Burkholderia pseudomallei 305]KGC89235.1 hypothetical protein DO71_5162 [Burkholderia pseudomallei]
MDMSNPAHTITLQIEIISEYDAIRHSCRTGIRQLNYLGN